MTSPLELEPFWQQTLLDARMSMMQSMCDLVRVTLLLKFLNLLGVMVGEFDVKGALQVACSLKGLSHLYIGFELR